MKEEGFNPNAVITDQVIDALANIQDHGARFLSGAYGEIDGYSVG